MDVGTRRILHYNVTATPTAEWALQQFREALPGGHAYQFVIHDHDRTFSNELDKEVTATACGPCERRSERQRRIHSGSASAERGAANVSTPDSIQRASSQVGPEYLDCTF